MDSFADSPLFIVIIVLLVLASVFISIKLAVKMRGSVNRLGGVPSTAASGDSAYILGVTQTSWYINNLPMLQLDVAVFPANGPMETATCKQAFSYVDIPQLAPGTLVSVAYGRDKKGAIKGLRVEGIRAIEWTGDPDVIKTVNELVQSLQGVNLLPAQGMILSTVETGAYINGSPVFKYHVSYATPDGRRIEGDTYQAARPWLKETRAANSAVPVQYSAIDPQKFALGRQ